VIRFHHPDGEWRDLEQATLSTRDWVQTAAHGLPPGRVDASSAVKPESDGNTASGHIRITAQQSDGPGPPRDIICKAARQNRFFLDSRGYVAPCCWVSNRDRLRPGDMLRAVALAGRDLDEFNIFKRPIEEILSDPLFTTDFPALWKSGRLSTCRKKCGRHHRNVKTRLTL
jgi:hypothetical protein